VWGLFGLLVYSAQAQDPRPLTLQESLRMANERNLRLQSARYEAAAVLEGVPKTFTDFLPKLRGDARFFVSTRPEFAIPANSLIIPPVAGVTTSPIAFPAEQQNIIAGRAWDNIVRLRIDQPLFTGFRLTSNYTVAKLDQQIGEARLTQAHHQVAEQVKVAYFTALKVAEDRQAAEARVRSHQAEIRFTESLIAGGRATASALPPLRATLAAARQEVLEATQRMQVVLDELKRVVGLDPLEEVRPAYQPEERVLAVDLDQATRLAQSQRPELKELSLGVDRAREGLTQARSSLYPQMNLYGMFEKQPQEVIHPVGEILSAGVLATWTFWEWNRSGHERAEAEFRRLRAVTDLQDRRAAIIQEVRAAFADVRMAEGRVTAFREEVESARSAAKVAEERFRDKVGVERDVTISKIEAIRALARYRAAIYDAHVARARLERVLGTDDLPTDMARPILTKDSPDEQSAPAGAPRSAPSGTPGFRTPPQPKAPFESPRK
jgi:outer membrane protein